jgi:hypothetical protein
MRRHVAIIGMFAACLALGVPWTAGARDEMPAMGAMNEGMHHHMAMTALRPERPGDKARADAIVAGARAAMKRWPDVAAVEAAGFRKFAPGVSLPIEHYTNDAFARASLYGKLDPEHPTSMIFERHGQTLALVGVMYTAGAGLEESDLNAMVPLSIAQWHRHVNLCFPPAGTLIDPAGQFGFFGTIETQASCEAANGRWSPQVFGWMVHVWPGEHDQKSIWAVDRHDEHGRGSMSM